MEEPTYDSKTPLEHLLDYINNRKCLPYTHNKLMREPITAFFSACNENRDKLLYDDVPIQWGTYSLIFSGNYCEQPVIIKKICLSKSMDILASAYIEIQTYMKLQTTDCNSHPNIVKLITYFSSSDTQTRHSELFLVFESAKCDLFDYINTHSNNFKAEHIFEILYGTCVALKHIHDANIVHKDIKIENILIMDTKSNNNPPVTYFTRDFGIKLCDFGLAMHIDSDMYNIFAGTVYTMAPEIVTRSGTCAPAADIWALGVVLYLLLYGVDPFTGKTDQEIMQSIINDEPKIGKKYSTSIPLKTSDQLFFNGLLRIMLQKEPAYRPTAGELMHLIHIHCYED